MHNDVVKLTAIQVTSYSCPEDTSVEFQTGNKKSLAAAERAEASEELMTMCCPTLRQTAVMLKLQNLTLNLLTV